jgi:uncharacterized protein YndB with AHSA1/START domain
VNQRTVAITRLYDAPRERVFAAWTKAEDLARWFGPKGFTLHSCETDPRPGGVFRFCMRSPKGKDYWVHGAYREVVAPERLVITCTAHDAQGIARLEEVIDVRFEEQRGRTRLILNAAASGPSVEAASMLEGMQQGWSETLDRLHTVSEKKSREL